MGDVIFDCWCFAALLCKIFDIPADVCPRRAFVICIDAQYKGDISPDGGVTSPAGGGAMGLPLTTCSSSGQLRCEVVWNQMKSDEISYTEHRSVDFASRQIVFSDMLCCYDLVSSGHAHPA